MFHRLFKIFSGKKDMLPNSSLGKKQFLRKKYSIFRDLLDLNNIALEHMADMSEKLSGEFLFDRTYIEVKTRQLYENVKEIIKNLNDLSLGKYSILYDRLNFISSQIEGILSRKIEIPVSSYTLFFDEITRKMVDKVGGKIANLCEVKNVIKLPVPHGFAISSYAFKRFMDHNDFFQKIKEKLSNVVFDNLDVLNRNSKELQAMIINGEIPGDLKKDIMDSYRRLCKICGEEVRVSVRSSAICEDGDFSFAGQFATYLNVPSTDILLKYKEVVASLFTSRVIFYFKTKGIQDYEMIMSVGILKMIDAKAGGVVYSSDPTDPKSNKIIINAVHGLGKCVVEGTTTPEIYVVSKDSSFTIAEKKIPIQKTMLFCTLDGEIQQIPLSEEIKGKPCLSEQQVKELANYAVSIEKHYGFPVDIEWAIDGDGNPYILQARRLRILAKELTKPIPPHIPGYNILLDKGIIACKGIGYGPVHVVMSEDDLKNFPKDAVLVAKGTSPTYVIVMDKATAIITDSGSTTGHMATLAREFQIPCILDTQIGTKTLKPGQIITVDAFNCNVYEGKVDELIELAEQRENQFKETQIFKVLQRVVKWIIPLNLVDPDDINFKPEFCQTYHDITRFCHEIAMNEMFHITDVTTDELGETHKLAAGIPLVIYIIDLDGGIEQEHPNILYPQHIKSIPLNAFIKGLSAMRWPQGSPVDIKGLLGMMAHTASIPEEELLKSGEKSFVFISRNYMNFQLRLGYHLSTVEAFAGENLNDNYIRFFFKGGGAHIDRRLRRVRLITEILKRLGFEVKVVNDLIDAVIKKYKRSIIESDLEILGKLTAYTKQLDMVMYDDAITQFYIEEFVKNHFIEK